MKQSWNGPFSFRQPPTSNWHKISWINCLLLFFLLFFFFFCFFVFVFVFVFVLYVAWKRGLPRKCPRFVLFRQIKKRSLSLLCVLDQVNGEFWTRVLNRKHCSLVISIENIVVWWFGCYSQLSNKCVSVFTGGGCTLYRRTLSLSHTHALSLPPPPPPSLWVEEFSRSWARAGCKKTLSLIHHPRCSSGCEIMHGNI